MRPYTYEFLTHAKERWLDRSVIDVFSECRAWPTTRSPSFSFLFVCLCCFRALVHAPSGSISASGSYAMTFAGFSTAKCSDSSRIASLRRLVFAIPPPPTPAAEFGGEPRSHYETAIRIGLLTINGRKVEPDYKIQNGDLICNRQVAEALSPPPRSSSPRRLACREWRAGFYF